MRDLHIQYVVDENGTRKNVLVPVDEFEELLEDLRDLAILAERREEPARPHDEVVAELKRDGYRP